MTVKALTISTPICKLEVHLSDVGFSKSFSIEEAVKQFRYRYPSAREVDVHKYTFDIPMRYHTWKVNDVLVCLIGRIEGEKDV